MRYSGVTVWVLPVETGLKDGQQCVSDVSYCGADNNNCGKGKNTNHKYRKSLKRKVLPYRRLLFLHLTRCPFRSYPLLLTHSFIVA
jgi:hypothetical protein